MFTKESLYINAVKYDNQLKLDYKKLSNEEIINTDNSVFLVDDYILPLDIALKLLNGIFKTQKTDDIF